MRLIVTIVGVIIGAVIGTILEILQGLSTQYIITLPITMIVCAILAGVIGEAFSKARNLPVIELRHLPVHAADFIALVIKKMRYRKKVRADVMAELAAHFEDELRDCKTDEEKEQKARSLIEEFGDPKLLGILLHRAKKRCRPLWRTIVARTFQTVGILFLCLVLYAVYISAGRPNIRINYAQEALRLTRPTADENLNAANLYKKAIDVFSEPPRSESNQDNQECSPPQVVPTQALPTDFIYTAGQFADLNDQQMAVLNTWLIKNTDSINYFIQASQKPYCWWDRTDPNNPPLIAMLLLPLASIRDIARMVIWQAKLKAYAGDIDGAFDDLLACFRAGNHFKGPRILIEQLVGTGIQAMTINAARTILSNTDLDSATLEQFQQKFQKLKDETVYTPDFETEKILMLDVIQRCYTDNGQGSGHVIPNELLMKILVYVQPSGRDPDLDYICHFGLSLISPSRKQITQLAEKFYGDAQKITQKTPWQLHSGNYTDFDEMIAKWSPVKKVRYYMVTTLLPAFEKVNIVFAESRAEADALITTIAVLRFKKEKGFEPENLQQLMDTGYIKELPPDPFSDKPLVYKKTDDGFTLYSIGQNFIDDGGQVALDENGKVKMWADDGDTVFWPPNK